MCAGYNWRNDRQIDTNVLGKKYTRGCNDAMGKIIYRTSDEWIF